VKGGRWELGREAAQGNRVVGNCHKIMDTCRNDVCIEVLYEEDCPGVDKQRQTNYIDPQTATMDAAQYFVCCYGNRPPLASASVC
jgi:hypothetical protein